MPKKSTRHVRESGLTRNSYHKGNNLGTPAESKTKHFQSVRIGLTNGKRWLSLKKRLGLSTDEDVAVYLLDLAESTSRYNTKYNEEENREVGEDKKNKAKTIQTDNTIENAGEIVRRSLRNQSSSTVLVAETVSADTTQTRLPSDIPMHARHTSRTKHHKNKAKHHKDKRKKKRHLKNEDNVSLIESNKEPCSDLALADDENNSSKEDSSRLVSGIDVKSNLKNNLRVATKTDESVATKTENIGSIENIENVNSNKNVLYHNTEDVNTEKIMINDTDEQARFNSLTTSSVANSNDENMSEQVINSPSTIAANVQSSERKGNKNITATMQSSNVNSSSNNNSNPVQEIEDRRLKKKRKRSKYDAEEEEDENVKEDSSEDIADDSAHKHRKKRHKHTNEHKNRKHHDVRKAPQDGIIVQEDKNISPATDDQTSVGMEKLESTINVENVMSEPQRLAIKIKLCQECNNRHLQDACPLTTPQYAISDSTSYEEWLNKHKGNTEVLRAIKSDDPMSEGYGKAEEDNNESDDDMSISEQCKTKMKTQNEEKQLIIDVDRPLYARDSLPECFELKISNSDHGLGIYAKNSVPMHVKLGPLVGLPVREMDIPDDFPMRHIWEIDNSGKTSYISTTNPLKSNWIRYIRPAETKEERSVAVITRQGELHLVTTQNIVSGMELTYWADSQSSAWTRKNKVDKTNCGGCNLNFAHPIYYRLHCCIFHDTNYSLTIRKYHCKVCGAAVLGKDNIMKHAAELHAGRGAYQCQYCKKFFLRLNYLEMHRTYGCAQNPQRSRPLCDFCGRKFCQPQKLKVHIKRMHSDMSEVLREFQCKLCLKLLGSRAALQRHMKEVHHKDVVGAATCDRCGKMFQNKSNLKIHMLTHSGVKPFKCKESGCKAAFTTKQCLQFHYKKVHGLTEEMMPKIERSVAYTFDAYSGGLIEDVGRGKIPRPSKKTPQQENNDNIIFTEDANSSSDLKIETSNNSTHSTIIEYGTSPKYKTDHNSRASASPLPMGVSTSSALEPAIENIRTEVDLYSTSRLQSKGSKKWLGEFNPPITSDVAVVPNTITHLSTSVVTGNTYDFQDTSKEIEEKLSPSASSSRTQDIMENSKLGLSVYRRTESANASLLVEAALDAAERDIGAVTSPILEDNDRDTNLYSISSQLQSPIPQRSPNRLDSYIQQQEKLLSPAPTPDNRNTPPPHLHVDYQLHRPVDYIGTPRTHNIDPYLHHDEIARVSSPNNYMHIQQEDLVSPSATPTPRYQDVHHHHHHHHHHHPVSADNLSSDEGDSVAQNLSLSVKEKTMQLDLSTSYKYDSLDQDFARERANFEPLVLNGELQGLDMSARGFHHGFGVQIQNARYHHHHLYEIAERQSVDLSRTGSYSISPTPLSAASQVSSGSSVTVDGRILSSPPPPPPLSGYNPSYPVSPAPYHPPRPGYHYSGYY